MALSPPQSVGGGYGRTIGLGTGVGAFLGFLLYGIVYLAQNPGQGPRSVLGHLAGANMESDLFLPLLMLGAFTGFLITGYLVGSPFALTVARGAIHLGALLFSGLLGIVFSILAFMTYWIAVAPDTTLLDAIRFIPVAYDTPGTRFRAFLAAGFCTGLIVGAYVRGGRLVKRATQGVSASIIGAMAGLVIYSFAYVLTLSTKVPDSSYYLIFFAEAIYSFSPIEILFVGMGALVGLMMARYSWRLYGLFTLIALVSVILGYLFYTLTVSFPRLPPERRGLSILLFIAEAGSLTMVVLYSFYTLDVATRKHWRRTSKDAPFSRYYMPKVCIQVPTFNEPPSLVIATLKSILNLDYPRDRLVLMVVDDSTKPESADPLAAFCNRYGIPYYHRTERSGYKAGALNYVARAVPEDVDLIAVIDADYQVEPEFLRETVGYFVDPQLGWLQTPQDYRNRNQSFLTEQYYLADAYFYRTVLPSRNEENSIIFCGTMGILNRRAFEQVGGWDERYITEDAELSIRLVTNGWKSLYINKTYGRGLIPPTYEGYKKQHYRWAFGGGKIFRGHFRDILFGPFTGRQRFDYFVGNIHWFEGLFVLAIGFAVLAMGWGDILGLPVLTHHSTEVLLIGLVPFFLLTDGLTRIHMVLRKSLNLSFLGTLRVLGMWFSVKFSNTFAACKAFIGYNIPFVRTPKAPEKTLSPREAWKLAIRLTRFESFASASFLLTTLLLLLRTAVDRGSPGALQITRFLLVFWLFYYALVFAAAPYYAYKSYSTFQPATEEVQAAPAPQPVAVAG